MANKKKPRKSGKKSPQAKRSRKRASSESANGPSATSLVMQSTAFLEAPAPAPAPAPVAPAAPAPVASTAPAFPPPVAPAAPTRKPADDGSLSTFRTPPLRLPPSSDPVRIVKHAPPSAGEVMSHEPRPAPKPKASRSRGKRSSRPSLPEKLTQAQIYETLAALLVPYARRMESEFHPKLGFCLKARNARTGREAHFGGVQALSDGVALHFFPLYGHPELLDGLNPELVNRLRSKTHFHFEELSAAILDDLGTLIRDGFERFVAEGMA